MQDAALRRVVAGPLEVAYLESGPANGPPAVLLHGFPYDVHAYAGVAPILAAAGLRVIVPYLRGYGPTRFASEASVRSGQQAALGHDSLALLDALALPPALLAGYDWGGRAACIAAALWPQRVRGLVTGGGYNIQDIAASTTPAAPVEEHRNWYQYYLHTPRGAAGLAADRRAFARLLWQLWSPTWRFDAATFERSAAAFDNPDFVPVVLHSYRHRYGYAEGDPTLDPIEAQLAARPPITVPTIVLEGADSNWPPEGETAPERRQFPALRRWQVVPGVGHNLPQEWPEGFARAVLDLASD